MNPVLDVLIEIFLNSLKSELESALNAEYPRLSFEAERSIKRFCEKLGMDCELISVGSDIIVVVDKEPIAKVSLSIEIDIEELGEEQYG